jgi:hypothetical protein
MIWNLANRNRRSKDFTVRAYAFGAGRYCPSWPGAQESLP